MRDLTFVLFRMFGNIYADATVNDRICHGDKQKGRAKKYSVRTIPDKPITNSLQPTDTATDDDDVPRDIVGHVYLDSGNRVYVTAVCLPGDDENLYMMLSTDQVNPNLIKNLTKTAILVVDETGSVEQRNFSLNICKLPRKHIEAAISNLPHYGTLIPSSYTSLVNSVRWNLDHDTCSDGSIADQAKKEKEAVEKLCELLIEKRNAAMEDAENRRRKNIRFIEGLLRAIVFAVVIRYLIKLIRKGRT